MQGDATRTQRGDDPAHPKYWLSQDQNKSLLAKLKECGQGSEGEPAPLVNMARIQDPKTYREAMESPNKAKWQAAVDQELAE